MIIVFIQDLLTMSILCLTHVDARLVPGHSRTKVEKILEKMNEYKIMMKNEYHVKVSDVLENIHPFFSI